MVDDRVFVDSGFVVALASPRDEHHDEAKALAARHETTQLVTTDAVLLEIGNTLARFDKVKAASIIRDFLSAEEVEIVRMTAELLDESIDLYDSTADQTWGLVDCVSFIVMRRLGIASAFTFDRHFVQAGFLPLTTGDGRS